MCRVGAIIQYGEQKITPEEIQKFLLNMESGGKDATGIALISKDKIVFTKSPGPASVVAGETFCKKIKPYLSECHTIILHTRAATHGNPFNNDNNHPILGAKYVLVHNGIVYLEEKLPAKGATDTEQLLRAMEKYGISKAIRKARGWASLIFVGHKNKNEIFFYRSGAQMSVTRDAERKMVFMASTEAIIKESINDSKDFTFFSPYIDTLYHCIPSTGKIEKITTAEMKGARVYVTGYSAKDYLQSPQKLVYPNSYYA